MATGAVGRVMTRSVRARSIGGALVAAVVSLTVPASASAETTLWTLTASPLAVTTGADTTFALTATNEDPLAALLSSSEIGCVVLDVPVNFVVASAVVTGSNAGNSWGASRSGNRVKVRAGSGGDRLELLEWVSFNVRATAMSAGSLTWNATAYRQQDCSGSGALLGVPPIVLVTGPIVTPTPTPTPVPTPTPSPTPSPTPTPTPTPTPLLPLPSLPLPSLAILPTPSPTPTPTVQAQSQQPLASEPPAAASEGLPPANQPPGSSAPSVETEEGTGTIPAASPSGSGTSRAGPVTSDSGAPTGNAANGLPRIAFEGPQLDVSVGSMDFLDGAVIWAVPAATIAGPGLLLLLLVALQSAGAMAWVPSVRRLRGSDTPNA